MNKKIEKPVYVFDFEGNGLEPTEIHVLSYRQDTQDQEIVSLFDTHLIKSFLEQDAYYVGHNIILFDIPNLERLTGARVRGQIIDTLALSWYLYPLRTRHGLDEWGEDLGIYKIQIDDWHGLGKEEYQKRCERDVEITEKLWVKLQKKLLELYTKPEDGLKLIKYLTFKLRTVAIAESNGWTLDIKKTKSNLKQLYRLRDEKHQYLSQVMPKIPVYYEMKYPARRFKKDGKSTETGERWEHYCKQNNLNPDLAKSVKIIRSWEAPNPDSSEQVKSWLFSIGWEPCTFKTNKHGKEVPQINNQDPEKKGELSDSVLELIKSNPELEALSGLFTLNHRAAILEGFLKNVNPETGKIKAQIAGLTNTLRLKHKTVVNLPKIDTPYGEYVRPCLVASRDNILCGSDQSSLEDRTKQHFMYYYDPQFVEEMTKPGFDPHLDLAVVANKLTIEDVIAYKKGERVKEIKPIRSNFKVANYSCTYGAFPPKIAKSAGISLDEAKELYDAYWRRNWSIKKIQEDGKAHIKTTEDGDKWVLNPVNKFWYQLRNEKDIFSTLNQGLGSYCFDTWVAFILEQLDTRQEKLVAQFHDEIVLDIPKNSVDRIKQVLLTALEKTNSVLKLNRKLEIDIQFGNNYGDIH